MIPARSNMMTQPPPKRAQTPPPALPYQDPVSHSGFLLLRKPLPHSGLEFISRASLKIERISWLGLDGMGGTTSMPTTDVVRGSTLAPLQERCDSLKNSQASIDRSMRNARVRGVMRVVWVWVAGRDCFD